MSPSLLSELEQQSGVIPEVERCRSGAEPERSGAELRGERRGFRPSLSSPAQPQSLTRYHGPHSRLPPDAAL